MSKPVKDIDLDKKKAQLPIHHDLDSLAGTWSEADAAEFDKATEIFQQVDEELWKDNFHP